MTRAGLKSTIYCTRGEHTYHYSTDAVRLFIDLQIYVLPESDMRYYIQKQLFYEQNINGTERESLLRNITPTSALDMGNNVEYRHCIHLYVFLYCHPFDPGDEISR